MAISALIGQVLQGFESLLAKASLSGGSLYSSNTSESSHGGKVNTTAAPRLSWGVLQIEPDEEDELKQHLWRLQFRKLENVLKQFSASVDRLRNAQGQGSGNSAHVMACQCIHMWLVQKAEAVKNRYLSQDGLGVGSEV